MAEDASGIVILGAGGHAGVLIDALRAGGEVRPLAVVDSDPARRGSMLLDANVLGSDDLLPDLISAGTKYFIVGVGGTRNNSPRRRLFQQCVNLGLEALSVVHPTATISPWAKVGAGVQALAHAVINAGATVGANVVVNTGAIVEHDCVIGDHVHIATGARLCGMVTVGEGAHVGAGAVVRQGISIGAAAVVGAGAVVVKDVPAAAVVAGVPAKPLKS